MADQPRVITGPFLEPWGASGGLGLGPDGSKTSAQQRASVARTSGGALISSTPGAGFGLSVPPTATEHFSRQNAAFINGTQVFPVGVVSTKILESPISWRNFLAVRNSSIVGGANIFIEFNVPATTFSVFRLAPNEILLLDTSVAQNDIYVVGDAAGSVSICFSVVALPT